MTAFHLGLELPVKNAEHLELIHWEQRRALLQDPISPDALFALRYKTVVNSQGHTNTQHVREHSMYCPNCGHSLADDVRFCTHCGAPAPQPPAGNETVSLTKASTNGSRFDFKTFATVIMVAGLFICVLGGIHCLAHLPLAYPDQPTKVSPPAKSSTTSSKTITMSAKEFWESGLHPLAQMAKRNQIDLENMGRAEKRQTGYKVMRTGILIFGLGALIWVSIKKKEAG